MPVNLSEGPLTSLNLKRFLEIQNKQKCDPNSDFYQQWSRGFDYENWAIVSVIGSGAYAKVYLVNHLVKSPDGAVSEKFYAMKEIRKTKVQDITFA